MYAGPDLGWIQRSTPAAIQPSSVSTNKSEEERKKPRNKFHFQIDRFVSRILRAVIKSGRWLCERVFNQRTDTVLSPNNENNWYDVGVSCRRWDEIVAVQSRQMLLAVVKEQIWDAGRQSKHHANYLLLQHVISTLINCNSKGYL